MYNKLQFIYFFVSLYITIEIFLLSISIYENGSNIKSIDIMNKTDHLI